MKKFKKNFHVAKKLNIESVTKLIKNYPAQYTTPKYLTFCKCMIEKGWKVRMYKAETVSKYIFVEKDNKIFKIRFSNHKPSIFKELQEDSDYYVGVSNKQVLTTEEIIKKLN